MASTIPNEGERRILQARKDIGLQRVILFTNDLTPSAATVFADLDEADFSGYSRVEPSWGSVSTGGDGRAVMTAAPAVFTHDGGGTANDIYGYAHIDAAPGNESIIAIERLPSPPEVMEDLGDTITVTLVAHERQQA